jgi:tol-pal system protein YbgF
MILDLTSLRYLLLLTFVLTGCAAQVPGQPVAQATGADGSPLLQEQPSLVRRVGALEEQVRQLEVRLQEQQAVIAKLTAHPTEMVIGNSQKTEPATAPPGFEATSVVGQTATDIYLKAFSDYASGRFNEAISGFNRFLERFPDNDFSGNAQFWLGECYYSQRLLSRALSEFSLVAERYPDGSKAPDALLRMANLYLELNQPDQQRQTEDLLLKLYPQSNAGKKLRGSR